jgi:hypothetical protein
VAPLPVRVNPRIPVGITVPLPVRVRCSRVRVQVREKIPGGYPCHSLDDSGKFQLVLTYNVVLSQFDGDKKTAAKV